MVKVKGNQKGLLTRMTNRVKTGKAIDSYKKTEQNRGREETRIVKMYPVPVSVKQDWPKARSIAYVKRITIRKGRKTTTVSYYLTSLKIRASAMAKGIRSHWAIENGLHYVKDVVTHEDAIQIKNTDAAATLSMIRNMAINIFRLNNCSSIKNAIRSYGGNLNLLLKWIE